MLVASRFSVPVAVVRWPELQGRMTAVVKLSYEVQADGTVVLAARPDPITPDTSTASGVLLFPSDFVRTKSQCDVLLVGRAITLPAAPTRLKLLGITKMAEHAAALGPMSVSSAQAPRVQYAPPDQRIPHARLPFRFRYERDGLVLDAIIPGPTPQVGYVRGDTIELQRPALDTIAIDPERRRVVVSLRAVIDGVDLQAGGWLVVDDLARLEPRSAEAFSWKRVEAVMSALQPSAVARRMHTIDDEEPTTTADELAFESALEESTITVTEDGSPPLDRPPSRTLSHALQRSKATTLPFKKVAENAIPSRPSFAETTDIGRSTVLTSNLPQSSPLPFAPARPVGDRTPATSRRTVPPGTPPATPFERPVQQPRYAAPLEVTPTAPGAASGFDLKPVVPAEPPADKYVEPIEAMPESSSTSSGDMSIERLSAIKSELWAGTEPRRAVLRRHGLTELKWRMVERAFVKNSNTGQDQRLLAMLSGLRQRPAKQLSAVTGVATPHAAHAHAPTEQHDVENADTSDAEGMR